MSALVKLSEDADNLYEDMVKATASSDEGPKKVFFQSDLQDFAADASKSLTALMGLIQELTSHSLLRTSKLNGSLCWSTRPREAAKKIAQLNENEKVVYAYVEEAHQKGTWIKEVKKKTNISPNLVDKAFTKLENAKLIQSVKNIRSTQKSFMLAHLIPGVEVTGGSFFDLGSFDEGLVQELSNIIIFHVRAQSWVESKMKRPKRETTPVVIDDDDDDNDEPVPASTKQKKRKRESNTGDIEDLVPPNNRKHRRSSRHDPETDTARSYTVQLAYPAGTRDYPTVESIHHFISNTDAIRGDKAKQLEVFEIAHVIDALVWDDKLEKIGDGYRTVRGVQYKKPGAAEAQHDDEYDSDDSDYEAEKASREWWKGNGLTQVPCGRCPVFDLCEEGGPINAGNCVYFQEWLGNGPED